MQHKEYFNHWYDGILNSRPFCICAETVKTVGMAWGFKIDGKWQLLPKFIGKEWQYANAMFYIKVGTPFALFMQIRWNEIRLWQGGIGWKDSGRFAIHCRFQTDESAAAGYHTGMPNTDQAHGWEFGRH